MAPIPKPAKGSGRSERQTRRQARKRVTDADDRNAKAAARASDLAIRFACFLRDGRKCRAFGTPLLFETDNLAKLAHNHHVVYRSAGGSDAAENRITLSPRAHALVHETLLTIEMNAFGSITFKLYKWAEDAVSQIHERTWIS